MNQKSPVCPYCGGTCPFKSIAWHCCQRWQSAPILDREAAYLKNQEKGVDKPFPPAILDKVRREWLLSNFHIFKKDSSMHPHYEKPVVQTIQPLVRFMYVRDFCNVPIATLAASGADSAIGVALCHPKDNFCKKIGRIKAAARIHMKPRDKPFPKRMVQLRDEEGYGCFMSLEDACIQASVKLHRSFLPAPQGV